MVILKYLPLKEVLRSPAFFVGSGAGSFQLPKALANCFKVESEAGADPQARLQL